MNDKASGPALPQSSPDVPSAQVTWAVRICVWELTLACNCDCVHCGSSAGKARAHELTTVEALALVGELSKLGCESVTLSGGEPLLRPDWRAIAGAIRSAGIRLEMITNGLRVEAEADAIRDAGFFGVTFSVDGPAPVHDALRSVTGGLERLLRGADALRARGIRIGAVTQVNRLNLERLDEIQRILADHGFEGWQLQLTMPQGRARQQAAGLCLSPNELPKLEQALLRLRTKEGPFIHAADNIGYMSCNEPLLRTCPGETAKFWSGCGAGLAVVGITSDGTVRGCLSQPPAANEGNIRERTLTSIWQDPNCFNYNRRFHAEELSGSCKGCAFGKVCRGGCRSLSMAASPDDPRSNPYCLFHVSR